MTKTTQSPWLHHRKHTPAHPSVKHSFGADVVIVGAGIAGLSTAYFTLRDTKRHVTIIEATRVAHGATGHNAGQLVSYFERPFHELVDEFGKDIAVQGQHDVYSAWELLAEIQKDLRLQTPCLTFTGYAGILDEQTLHSHLRDALLKQELGIVTEQIYISQAHLKRLALPSKYAKVFLSVPHSEIMQRLETGRKEYFALLSGRKGCMNSAAFTAEVATKLLERYPHRFQIFEDSPVASIELYRQHAELDIHGHHVTAKRVILCTNGFENFSLINHAGADIDPAFHHLVRGSVGYMAAFLERPLEYPTAISYLPETEVSEGAYDTDPYFYLTRRPHAQGTAQARQDLICVGGPEELFDDTAGYSKAHPYPEAARKKIDQFLKTTYRHAGKHLTFAYLWHGLMGYTPNGIRCVGVEPCNPTLLYNLGCNGVGILPSIYGGLRIGKLLRGEHLPPSMFDPRDQRGWSKTRSFTWASRPFLIGSVVTMLTLIGIRLLMAALT